MSESVKQDMFTVSQSGAMKHPILETAIPEVTLRELTERDAHVYFELVQRNREHLTQFGDYKELVSLTLWDIEVDFANRPDDKVRMGIWRKAELMGRIDLSSVALGAFVLGYWIGSEYLGKGYVTAGCSALLDYGQKALGATEYWAGVPHGNTKSAAVLERVGFSAVERLEYHTCFYMPAYQSDD